VITQSTDEGLEARLTAAEGLRGLAIALVLAVHAEGLVGALLPTAHVSLVRAFSLGGHTGVSLFFVLSAFLLSRRFLAERSSGRRTGRRRYFTARALRIYPLYAPAVLLAALACAEQAGDLLHAVPYLLFLNGVPTWVTPLLPYSGAWWSLAIEVQFYLALPLLADLLRRRALAGVVLGLLALLYVGLTLGWVSFPSPVAQFTAAHSLLGRAPLFAWGIVAAWVYDRHGPALRAALARHRLAGRAVAELLMGASLVLLAMLLRWFVAAPYLEREVVEWPAWHVAEGGLWAIILLVALLGRTALGRILESAVATFLGRVSYPLFLVHTAVMITSAEWIRSHAPGALLGWSFGSVLLLIPILGAAVAVATLVHVAIERPALLWKARVTAPSAGRSRVRVAA
jgi:peptidoglycan/LPS O-acetylase OafA/YrhL